MVKKKMNIYEFLKSKRLTNAWLKLRLAQRGFEVSDSNLSRIISGERNSVHAQAIRDKCVEICDEYERMVNCSAETCERCHRTAT